MEPTIRAASISDAAAMLAIYAPVVLETTISWEYVPPTLEQFEARITKTLAAGYPWIVLLDEFGVIAGFAYASDFRDRYGYRFCCESSIYMRTDVRGRGWGKGLYSTLISVLQAQGFVSVIGGMAYPNPASEALHRALGFEMTGVNRDIGYKFGEWLSVCFMQKDFGARGAPIGERPLGFREVWGSPAAGRRVR